MNSEFIERHSRQLILPKWSLALQEEISKIKVSIPQDKFLCMYLIALGVSKFHFQNCDNFETFYSKIPNWERESIIYNEINESDYIIYLNKPNIDLYGQIGTIRGEIINSKFHLNASSTVREDEGNWQVTINDIKYPSQEIGIFLALYFSNFLNPHYS